MGKRGHSPRDQRMRVTLIREAARIMAEESVADYASAKRKAAERVGAPTTRNLPSNAEVEDALVEYQQIFADPEREDHLRHLREQAVAAMEFFEVFRPRLVGAVLAGTADEGSAVHLHLFADTPETVALYLMDRGVPYETDERRLRYGSSQWITRPVFRFVAGDVPVALTVFNEREIREAPRSDIHNRPMRRAGIAEVRKLVDVAGERQGEGQ